MKAIYENGVLRPVEPIRVYDREHVPLTLEPRDESLVHPTLTRGEAQQTSPRRVARSIAETQARLKDISGSFADLIIEERGDH